MLKKSIKFKDLDGNDIVEDFYFNLNKAELAEMELGKKGGLSAYMKRIVEAEDTTQLVPIFKELLVKSVGRRSEDGRRFIKNQEIIDDFMQSDAYSELFIELATQHNSAIEFMNGIVPAGLEEEMKKISSDQPKETVQLPAGPEEPSWLKEGRTPTPDEVKNATPEQLRMAFQRKQADQATPPPA